jgi:hypothetical protein
MIYLKETFNLAPASPETRDEFVAFAQSDLVPAYERLGARLVAAWFSHAEWYGQITQVLAFQSLHASLENHERCAQRGSRPCLRMSPPTALATSSTKPGTDSGFIVSVVPTQISRSPATE